MITATSCKITLERTMKRKILVSAVSVHLFLFLGACNQQHKLETPFPTGANAPLLDVTAQPSPEPTAVDTDQVETPQIAPPTNPQVSRPIIPPANPQPLVQPPAVETKTVPPPPLPVAPQPPVKPPTPVKPNPLLTKKWVHKGGALTKTEFLGLLKFGADDPAVQSVIAHSLKVIGGTNPEDLNKWVQVCPNMDKLGEYINAIGWYFEAIPIVEILDPTRVTKHIQAVQDSVRKDGGEVVTTDIHKSYIGVFYLESRNKICLPTLEKSYEEIFLTLVHELVHFSRTDFILEPKKFLEAYPDKVAYIKNTLYEAEDEMEAFTTMFQVQIRLDRGTSGLPEEVKGAFNEQGDLINKDKLYEALISWGYDKMKTDEYFERLRKMNVSTLALDLGLEKVMLERMQFQMGNERSDLVQASFADLNKDSDDVEVLVKSIGERLDKKDKKKP
jgi:hypothetical protein